MIVFLWNLFNTIGIVGALPCTVEQYDKRTGKTYTAYAFVTFTLPFLVTLWKLWYVVKDGKTVKVLPAIIADLLTPVAIAFWCASDACFDKSQGTVRISTESFTLDEVNTLREVILHRYSINSSCYYHKPGYIIYIPKREVPKLQALVGPHIPSMMAYREGPLVPPILQSSLKIPPLTESPHLDVVVGLLTKKEPLSDRRRSAPASSLS